MKISAIILVLLLPMVALATPFDDKYSVLGGDFKTFRNGQEVTITYHRELIEKKTENLLPLSLIIHKKTLAIFNAPSVEKYKIDFLNNFPRSFSVFLEIFHPDNFDQLYDGFVYVHMLHELSKEFPKICGEIILNLSSEACLDADAPNYLRATLESFSKSHPTIYRNCYQKLNPEQQKNIEKFLAASIHEAGEGTCSYENTE